ncbi:D-glycero-beta-D-manno-heptose 1,7-bisphosphate 7-phosphatase [Blochmannia endosymbiont of Polyrhachis (Hedomyrma) turneri]|uniref:D-glycero-beta-D-manno-heptose 1,7-bisphosphate 7-phosphatase n=1 Tax=Blochmannia endosymbiont of Polyrhachis (Hedomyrma) turneri TaxID=1505596 RepID=UPI00061A7D64|nr:D-glycero-beta-D-manno-heptose 1,7-bisphosphate 7-phosphatase [Blochmannia endosymbiont of Polyrhachis (Hedomyrma) turneri]AKC59848.1 D,D-heptose 1,7-bisphosphate phosphatase [Blochmannia endosymbiont of Polyrhachis (Hedomyrma) turneri]
MSSSIFGIFLDRDGTINIDQGYSYNITNFIFINGVIDAMIQLKKMKFCLIIVTNQSGIARGFFSKEQFIQLTKWMIKILKTYQINIDGIYFCPHHPQGAIKQFKQNCNCRKPKPGMLLNAEKNLNLNMNKSYIIGDTTEDMLAGQAAGIGTKILVRSGKMITKHGINSADYIIDSLAYLPEIIKLHKNF